MKAIPIHELFSAESQKTIQTLSEFILASEPNLEIKQTDLMGSKVLGFLQSQNLKYAFASQKNHITFHNMVMYCYPELAKSFKELFPQEKFLKSCIHFKEPLNLDFEKFRIMIETSAQRLFPKPR